MNKMIQEVKQFLNDEEGVTAIEYGLIAALIAAVIIGSVQILGGTLNTVFTNINALIAAA